MRRFLTALATTAALSITGPAASGYEPVPTHPGLTALAARESSLHRFLHRSCGVDRGLMQTLQLDPNAMTRRSFDRLRRDLRRLDPAGGYAPSEQAAMRTIGWLLAGSVLAQRPASLNRHHFYTPPLRSGLDDPEPLSGAMLSLLAMLDGGDTVRQFFTGTGFDSAGQAAPDWVESRHNPHSLTDFRRQLALAVRAELPSRRRHHLALAMLALGATLHVLQDMASPTHVRNDFQRGHLRKLGSSLFDRGSAFERFVARRYGQFGLPAHHGAKITRRRVRDFFTNERWNGLADITSINHFSPGTLPAPVTLRPDSSASELRQRLNGRLPLAEPRLGPLDLRCVRTRGRCYQRGPHGPRVAYELNQDGQLRLLLDRRCHAASARHLLPLAVAFSSGLIDHLLGHRITVKHTDQATGLVNAGPALERGTVTLLVELEDGRRRALQRKELAGRTAAGSSLLATKTRLKLPAKARALVALFTGRDAAGDEVVAVGRLSL